MQELTTAVCPPQARRLSRKDRLCRAASFALLLFIAAAPFAAAWLQGWRP